MSDMSDADFASYVDRIMACRDAEDAAKDDTKLVYAAAADAGIDKTALGLFVRVERMDQSQVAKANRKDELTEEYRARYRRGKASHVRVREAAAFSPAPNPSVSEAFDPETGEFSTTPEINEPRNPAPQESAQMLAIDPVRAVVSPVTSAAGQEGIVDRQPIQPETANSGEAQETAAAVGASPAIQDAEDIGSQPDGGLNVAGPGAQLAEGEGAHNAPSATILTREQGILRLRPKCQQPGACKSSGGKSHCWSCEKAGQQVGAA